MVLKLILKANFPKWKNPKRRINQTMIFTYDGVFDFDFPPNIPPRNPLLFLDNDYTTFQNLNNHLVIPKSLDEYCIFCVTKWFVSSWTYDLLEDPHEEPLLLPHEEPLLLPRLPPPRPPPPRRDSTVDNSANSNPISTFIFLNYFL